MVFYEPHTRDRALLPHDPLKAVISPRPIGWISTLDENGVPNLAPYSFFALVSENPAIVMFSSDGLKDSAVHARDRGEFVWNLATYDLREQMNLSSAVLPRGESEFAFTSLEPAASVLVAPPRVAAAKVSMECRVTDVRPLVDLTGKALDRWTVFGQVVGVHLDESILLPNGQVDPEALQPIGRGGYRDEYAVPGHIFRMVRPVV